MIDNSACKANWLSSDASFEEGLDLRLVGTKKLSIVVFGNQANIQVVWLFRRSSAFFYLVLEGFSLELKTLI